MYVRSVSHTNERFYYLLLFKYFLVFYYFTFCVNYSFSILL